VDNYLCDASSLEKMFVMPALAASVAAAVQCCKTWIPACAGKTEGAVDFPSTLFKSLGFEPRVV
jgi:hypothetical protein